MSSPQRTGRARLNAAFLGMSENSSNARHRCYSIVKCNLRGNWIGDRYPPGPIKREPINQVSDLGKYPERCHCTNHGKRRDAEEGDQKTRFYA
jgi:hypothetical protein